jgi:hypothetical protein
MVTISITAAPGRDRIETTCPRAARPNVGPMGRSYFVTLPHDVLTSSIMCEIGETYSDVILRLATTGPVSGSRWTLEPPGT